MTVIFVGTVARLLVFGTLLASGAAHLWRPARFGTALAAQGIRSRAVRRALWMAVIAGELVVGAAGLTAGALAWPVELHVATLAAMLLYAAYAHYLWALVRRIPGAPCGCGAEVEPATSWTVARAAVLSLISMLALLAGSWPGAQPPAYAALAALCAAGLGITLWQVPAATAVRQR
jgi:hypothetical protein